MNDILYPHVNVKIVGEDGNAFSILGRVQKALERAKVPKEEIDAVTEDAMSSDYNHLLSTVMNTVDTTGDEEEEDLKVCAWCDQEFEDKYDQSSHEPVFCSDDCGVQFYKD